MPAPGMSHSIQSGALRWGVRRKPSVAAASGTANKRKLVGGGKLRQTPRRSSPYLSASFDGRGPARDGRGPARPTLADMLPGKSQRIVCPVSKGELTEKFEDGRAGMVRSFVRV